MSQDILEDVVEIQIGDSLVKVRTVEDVIRKVFGNSSIRTDIRNFPSPLQASRSQPKKGFFSPPTVGFLEPIDGNFERYLDIFLEGNKDSSPFVFRGNPPLEAGNYIRAGITTDLGSHTKAIYVQRLGDGRVIKRTDFMSGYNPSAGEADRLGIL